VGNLFLIILWLAMVLAVLTVGAWLADHLPDVKGRNRRRQQ